MPWKLPVFIPVNETRRDRAHVCACANHEEDDEEEGLKVEQC